MGLRIDGNTPSLFAQRQAEGASNRLVQGLGQLATGLRINRAAEDAAGLAIAERFRSQVRQFNQEVGNLQSGVNAVQTADAALGTQQEGVQRLRELALQASNGTLTDEQRAAINEEAQQITEQIDATAEGTEFNGTQLLNGDAENIELGTEGGNQINIVESTAASLGIAGLDLSTAEGAANAVDDLDNALNTISQQRASLGAQENRLDRAIEVREEGAVNAQEAESRIRDLDVARGVIEQTRNQILQEAGIAGILQGNIQAQTASRLLGA